MARQRLINVDFLTTSFMGVSNKAKLLYMVMIFYADDLGFVGNTFKLVEELDSNEKETPLELVGNGYINALHDLDNKGYIYTFVDNHGNHIHLIRHWFIHNRWIKGLTTNYKRFLKEVELVDGKWCKKKPFKEDNNIEQNKPKQIKTNNIDNEISDEEWNKLFDNHEENEVNDYD